MGLVLNSVGSKMGIDWFVIGLSEEAEKRLLSNQNHSYKNWLYDQSKQNKGKIGQKEKSGKPYYYFDQI